MSLPHEASPELFRGRHFNHEIIPLYVRWYVTYKLSDRDLVEMMAERHVNLAHTTIMRWVQRYIPFARHVRTGLHRRRGHTAQPVERSHVPTRDRLRGARGLRTVHTGQRFLESFEAFHALRRGTVKLRLLVPGYRPTRASMHERDSPGRSYSN